MNSKEFAEIFGTLLHGWSLIGLVFSLFYLQNQNRQERIVSDERWSRLLEAFTDFKNVTVSRFAELDKRSDQKLGE